MFLKLPDGKLFYSEYGDPSSLPLVFIHGFPLCSEMWKPQIDYFKKNYRVIAYDVRGHGKSDVGDGLYTIDGHVDDLLALLDHLKIKQAVFIGLSMGGYITLRAFEKKPARFISLVLCDTRSEADDNEGKIKRAAGIKDVKRNGSQVYAETAVQSLFTKESLKAQKPAIAIIWNMIAKTPPLSIAGSLLALSARTDTTPSLPTIKIPTLILVGEDDILTPPALSKQMHQKIKGSEMQIIPRAAHLSNLENPEIFNQYLSNFLQKNSLHEEGV